MQQNKQSMNTKPLPLFENAYNLGTGDQGGYPDEIWRYIKAIAPSYGAIGHLDRTVEIDKEIVSRLRAIGATDLEIAIYTDSNMARHFVDSHGSARWYDDKQLMKDLESVRGYMRNGEYDNVIYG